MGQFATSWTYFDKQAFHRRVDELIWGGWGNHFYLRVRGTSDFARCHAAVRITEVTWLKTVWYEQLTDEALLRAYLS